MFSVVPELKAVHLDPLGLNSSLQKMYVKEPPTDE